MARIYPERLPESVLSDPKRSAERLVYEKLSQLPAPFVIFYSVAWQARRSGTMRDGEADFVIAHPDLGILVMEVKGGRVTYEPQTGRWVTMDREDQVFTIDPVEQARTSHYVLLEKLRDLAGWDRNRFLTIGHAVCFPISIVGGGSLRLDSPREIIIDCEDLEDIVVSIRRVFAHYADENPKGRGALGKDRLQIVESLLAPSFQISTPLGVELALEDKRLVELTDQQFHLLDFLGNRRRALIAGCAGSGKTMLAIEKARRLSEQGFEVLLTCFNSALADDLTMRLPEITVLNFHRLCREMANRAGLILPRYTDGHEYNEVILPQALMNAIDETDVRFDAIIVDEGQDFRENYWIALTGLLREAQSAFYVFYDDNQNLYGGTAVLSGIIDEVPFVLSENCRNTQAIHRVVASFYSNRESLLCRTPPGRVPEYTLYKDDAQLQKSLQSLLHHIITDEHIRTEDVVVLTPHGQDRTVLKPGLRLGNFILTSGPPERRNEIQATSIYRFKGLERRVVIVAEVDNQFKYNPEMVMYVGCSRARTHLVLFVEEKAPPDFLKQLEKLCTPAIP